MGKVSERVSEFVAAFQRKPRRLSVEEYALKMLARGLDENGNQKVSSVPQEPPIGYKRQPSMVEIVQEAIRSERLKREAEDAGFETFEESDDFDVGDDDGEQLRSVHELPDAASPADLRRLEEYEKSERVKRRNERFEYWQDRQEFTRSLGQEPPKKEGDDSALARRGPGSQRAESAPEGSVREVPERPGDAF